MRIKHNYLKMKRIAALLAVLCCTLSSQAQFSDSTYYYLKYASTGSINHTKDGSSYLLNNAFAFKISREKVSLNASASYVYGKQDHNPTNDDLSAALDFNLYTEGRKFYYWGVANYDKSLSLKINRRFQGGLGVGYDVIHRPNATLNLSNGILFENSDLFLKDTIRDVNETFRNSFRVTYKWAIKDIVIIEGSNYLQNSLSNGNDIIIKTNNSLSLKLRAWLLLTAAVTYNRLNRTDRENLLINYGITMEKYF